MTLAPKYAVPDVAEWLTEQGLAKYVEPFVENEIDFDVLASGQCNRRRER